MIGLLGIHRYKSFTIIKQSFDPEEDDQSSLIANWDDDISQR
jgi:hypothetical protein